MRRSRPLTVRLPALVLSAAALLLATSAAHATEVLKLRNGDLVPGDVVSLDEEGVTFQRQQGGEVHVLWSQVLPVSRYELWASTLEPDDAGGRLRLAGWALDAELFHQARREAQKAQGVGDEEQKASAESLLGRIAAREAEDALARIDAHVEKGELEDALDVARRYLRVAPPGGHADEVRARVPDLLVRIERAEADAVERAEEEALDRDAERKQGWIDANLRKALETKQKAQEDSIEAYAYLAKGTQTRARRALAASERGFLTSRDLLKRVRRAAGPGAVAEQCQREMEDADRRMLDLLTRWGQLEVGNKAWKKADAVVDRGLRIDPVDAALLELRRQIDDNWIRRRVSDITNAEGRETSR